RAWRVAPPSKQRRHLAERDRTERRRAVGELERHRDGGLAFERRLLPEQREQPGGELVLLRRRHANAETRHRTLDRAERRSRAVEAERAAPLVAGERRDEPFGTGRGHLQRAV